MALAFRQKHSSQSRLIKLHDFQVNNIDIGIGLIKLFYLHDCLRGDILERP